MHKSKINVPPVETIERTVNTLRKRFNILLPKCGGPNRLAKRLSEFDSYFNEGIGIYEVTNAKRGKAGEVAMVRILAAMELLAATETPSAPPSRVDKAFARMNIGTTYEPKYKTTKKLKTKMQASKS